RRLIPRRPENLIGREIIRSRVPGRGAARLPRIAFPTFVARFAGTRHCIEPPLALARGRLVSVNESAYSVLSARDADHDQILPRQLCPGEAVTGAIIRRSP